MYYDGLRRRAKAYKAIKRAEIVNNVAIETLIAPVYIPLHEDVKAGLHLTYCLSGGRGSGKSSFISLEIIDGLKEDPEANAIIFRRTGNTLRDSCYSQIAWAISELGQDALWRGSVSPMQYVNVKTGQQILFRGLDDAQKLKSVKPQHGFFKYLWIEEFSELQGPNTVRSVNQSIIRGGKDFRIFYSFNPPRSRNNWANLFSVQLPDNAVTFRTNYTQMPPAWLGSTFILEAEALKDMPNAIWSTYGMTETLSHIALRRLNGPERNLWYTPFDGVNVSLNPEGCLVINAPAVHDGPLVTNDIAELSGLNFRILGRKDNVVCSGGIKIQIEEVERLLHPHLRQPFLISKAPDMKLGEQVVLLTTSLDVDAVRVVCQKVLPRYWQPRQYLHIETIPLTATGKPARAEAEILCRSILAIH